MAIGLALLAAVVYGSADFLGGIASRRTAPVAVVVLSQAAGVAVLAVSWPLVPGRFYSDDVGWGVVAGIAGGSAIVALYAALAIGRMGVVSPITAVIGAAVPVVVGFAIGGRPATLALAGVACAFIAVVLVSANVETKGISLSGPGLGLALFSGIGIGVLLVTLGLGHKDAGLARMAVARAVSISLLLAYAFVRRQSLRPVAGGLPTILLAGALDMAANVLYVVSSRFGMLAIVAVLTSLYPAATVFLARVVLHERLSRIQWVGVGFAAAGVAFIAA